MRNQQEIYTMCVRCNKTIPLVEEINGFYCGTCNILQFSNKDIIEIPETEVIRD